MLVEGPSSRNSINGGAHALTRELCDQLSPLGPLCYAHSACPCHCALAMTAPGCASWFVGVRPRGALLLVRLVLPLLCAYLTEDCERSCWWNRVDLPISNRSDRSVRATDRAASRPAP
eukprot:scaffold15389_cov131-Isochrysis_galbana.AAC.3